MGFEEFWAEMWAQCGPSHMGWDQREAARTAFARAVHKIEAAERERRLPDIDELAQQIRRLNGSSKMGAGALAERLIQWLRERA